MKQDQTFPLLSECRRRPAVEKHTRCCLKQQQPLLNGFTPLRLYARFFWLPSPTQPEDGMGLHANRLAFPSLLLPPVFLLSGWRLLGVSLFNFPLRRGDNTTGAILQAAGFYKWGTSLNSLTQSRCQSSRLFTGDITRDAFCTTAKTTIIHRLIFLVQQTSENRHSSLASLHRPVSSGKYMIQLPRSLFLPVEQTRV